jgi:hypothetical protein
VSWLSDNIVGVHDEPKPMPELELDRERLPRLPPIRETR